MKNIQNRDSLQEIAEKSDFFLSSIFNSNVTLHSCLAKESTVVKFTVLLYDPLQWCRP